MSDPQTKLVEIYRARNLPEAHTLRMALEEADIRVRVDGELLQGVIGELPLGWDTCPRLLVDSTQADAAREILRRTNVDHSTPFLANDSNERPACLACGQPMAETEVKCSACGWSFQGQTEAESLP